MAFNPFKILKGLIIQKENTLTPDKIEITPNGTASTTTTIQSSQTANRTITLPDATDTLATNTQITTVQTNLDNHINDTTDAHDASAISNVPAGTVAATDVQSAINELDGDIQGHITDTADAHDASAISNSPLGNLTSTDVQSALNELQTEIDIIGGLVGTAATPELDNLGTTAINASLLPDADVSYEIGSPSLAWNAIYTSVLGGPSSGNLNISSNSNAIEINSGTTVDVIATNNINLTAPNVSINSTNPINVNTQIITGVASPVSASDAVNKEYADSIAAGFDPKAAVRVATTTSLGGTYSTTPNNGRFTGAATTVDGVLLAANDRVLVKDQVDQKQNGIYVYNGAGQYTRATDSDGSPAAEVSAGNFTFTTQGTLNSASGFVLLGNGILTLNTDNLVWTQSSGGSSGASRFLDNLLSPTAINQDLLPSASNTRNLGSLSLPYSNSHVVTSNVNDGSGATRITLSSTSSQSTIDSSATSTLLIRQVTPTAAVTTTTIDNGAGATGSISATTGNATSNSGAINLTTGNGTLTSGNIAFQTGSSAGTRGSVTVNARSTQITSGPLNIQQGQTAVPVASQQSLIIPSSGSTEGLPLLTASDSSVREILTTGMEGLPQAQNLIDNGDAEGKLTSSTSILVPYADAAQSTPVDGTGGGTPNVTTAVTATNPLAGSKSYTLVKDAVNRQGQGWAIPFTVNPSNRARVLSIKFDYIVDSGTFVAGTSTTDSDVTVYIYDVTNSTLIQPSSFRLLSNSTTIADQFQAEFQTSQSGSSYRLILHCATTSASAYTLKVDNIIVSPNEYVFGTPISDWQIYTPTFTGFGTVSTQQFYWRRVGDSAEIRGRFTSGTPTATEARLSLPSGLTTGSDINTLELAGTAARNAGASTTFFGNSVLIEPSVTYLTFGIQASAGNPLLKQNGNAVVTAGDGFSLFARVKIAGWSSSVQMADSTSTRVVSFTGTLLSQAVTGGVTNINFTATRDSHAAWTGNTFVVPVSGDYIVSGNAAISVQPGTLTVRRNGTSVGAFSTCSINTGQSAGSVVVSNCVVGDVISLRCEQSITVSNGNLGISRISGPSQIASSETVAASYYVSTGASTASTSPINYDTRNFDTHNAVTTGAGVWAFTSPINGIYSVSGFFSNAAGSADYVLFVNGTVFTTIGAASAGTFGGGGASLVALNAGQTLQIRPTATVTPNGLVSGRQISRIDINRIGNRG